MLPNRRSIFKIVTGASLVTFANAGAAFSRPKSPRRNGITSIGQSLPAVEKFVQDKIADFAEVPGCAIAITKGNKILWARAYGKRNLRTNAPFTLETTHNLGSVTKTFMTTLMLTLLDRALVELDADVNTYLPYQLRNPYFADQPITLRMLLVGSRTGAPTGLSTCHVSSPLHVARSMRISRTARPHLLRSKAYGTYHAGIAFVPSRRTR